MKATFEWDEWGDVRVGLPPEHNIVKSLLVGELEASPELAQDLLAWLDQNDHDPEEISGEGFSLRVSGSDVTISSNYDSFPDTTYALSWLRDTVAAYGSWLRENLSRRPS